MTAFWLLAAALIACVYALFWWSLRHLAAETVSASDLSAVLDAHRQRRRELEQELAEGGIDNEQFDQLVAELDRELLELNASPGDGKPAQPMKGMLAVFATLAILPLVALSLYFALGRPDLIGQATALPSQAASTQNQRTSPAPSLEAAIDRLKARLQANPDAIEDWVLLARAYQATGKPQQAIDTYRRALELAPDNPDLQLFYAEALSQTKDNGGEPERLVQAVLKRIPQHPRALWLAGLIALQKNDPARAERYWQRLLEQMPPGSEARQQLAKVMRKSGMKPAEATASGNAADATAHIQVTVSLSPELASQAKPDQVVYIFARAAEGPPMPLAIVKKRVMNLPVTVTLDDSMAMMPQMKLSNFPRIIVGARIAKSGNAQGARGDLEGWSQPFNIERDHTVTLIIDQVRS